VPLLGGYSPTVDRPEYLNKVVVDHVALEFFLYLVKLAEGVGVLQVEVDFHKVRV
jgi:hypothetical protein